MVFVLLGVDAAQSDVCGIWVNLHSSREEKCLQGYFKTLVVEHRVVVMTAGSHQEDPKFNPMGSQF